VGGWFVERVGVEVGMLGKAIAPPEDDNCSREQFKYSQKPGFLKKPGFLIGYLGTINGKIVK
jgi:hypothetical protein